MKTKNFMTLILSLFVFSSALACRCGLTNIIDEFAESGFVGEVRITKVHKNINFDTNYYEIEVQEITTYKGEFVPVIRIYGSNDKRPNVLSCNRSVRANSKMMIYSKPSEDKQIYVGYCGHSRTFEDNTEANSSIARERSVLENLRKNSSVVNNENRKTLNFESYLDKETQLILEDSSDLFFLFKVRIDAQNKSKEICSVNKISKADKEKIKILLNTMDYPSLVIKDDKTPKNPYVLVGLYINPKDKKLSFMDWEY